MPEKTFAELEAERNALDKALTESRAQADAQTLKIRAMEAQALEAARASVDEALAQRVAKLLLSGSLGAPRVYGSELNRPARVVGHRTLVCRNCGHTRPADHQSDSTEPNAGGCKGYAYLTHDFHGADTVIETVEKLAPHHAIYIEGTITHPAHV